MVMSKEEMNIGSIFIHAYGKGSPQWSAGWWKAVNGVIASLGEAQVLYFAEKAVQKVPHEPYGASRYFFSCCHNAVAKKWHHQQGKCLIKQA